MSQFFTTTFSNSKTKHTTGSSTQDVNHVLLVFIITRLRCESSTHDMKRNNVITLFIVIFILSEHLHFHMHITNKTEISIHCTLFYRWVEKVHKLGQGYSKADYGVNKTWTRPRTELRTRLPARPRFRPRTRSQNKKILKKKKVSRLR